VVDPMTLTLADVSVAERMRAFEDIDVSAGSIASISTMHGTGN
jgi:hypothetical protein